MSSPGSRVISAVKDTCGSEAGSYLRLIASGITQPNAQGPSRTCNERKEEEEGHLEWGFEFRVEGSGVGVSGFGMGLSV